MANNISSALGSLNSLFNGYGSTNNKGQNGLVNGNKGGSGLQDLNDALAKGNKEGIMQAAKELQAGQSFESGYQVDFMQASFAQSGGNLTFQLSALSLSGMQSAFNTGDMMGTYSKTSASLQTITITGSMASLGSLNEILGGIDLSSIGYTGKPFNELSQSDAASLVSDGGFFSIDNTANRVADFVLKGAGDNLEMLKAGREGVINGYNEAAKIWGGDGLPEISQKTQEKLLEILDKRINELGGSVFNSAIEA